MSANIKYQYYYQIHYKCNISLLFFIFFLFYEGLVMCFTEIALPPSAIVWKPNNKRPTWFMIDLNSMFTVQWSTKCSLHDRICTLKSLSMPSNLLESSGSWLRMSSEPMKILSKWDQVRWTSNQMVMTESVVDSFFCQPDTSSKKWAMCLEVIRFCSWTLDRGRKEIIQIANTQLRLYHLLVNFQ